MSYEDLKSLPISEIAADNSIIFFWTTPPYLQKQLEVLAAWGFKYSTKGFCYVKLNKHNNNPFFGVGYYTSSNTEDCYIGTRGKMLTITKKVSQVIITPRLEHSRKPDEVYERIEAMYPNYTKLELFSRKPRQGWTTVGYDIDGLDIREVLQNLKEGI